MSWLDLVFSGMCVTFGVVLMLILLFGLLCFIVNVFGGKVEAKSSIISEKDLNDACEERRVALIEKIDALTEFMREHLRVNVESQARTDSACVRSRPCCSRGCEGDPDPSAT